MITNQRLNTVPWWNLTWARKSSMKVPLTITQLRPLFYNYFLTGPPRNIYRHSTKTFFKPANAKKKCFFLAIYFSCNCLKIKKVTVPHPTMKSNCILRIWSVNFSPLQFPLSKISAFPLKRFTIVLSLHSAGMTSSSMLWFTRSVIKLSSASLLGLSFLALYLMVLQPFHS